MRVWNRLGQRVARFAALFPKEIWLTYSVVLFILITVSVVRYMFFAYPRIDLGIYNQVLWNTAHGDWFAFTFNGTNYLGDHREWWLLPLALLYAVFPHALTPVIVQHIVVLSLVFPMYLIAREVLGLQQHAKRYSIAAAVLALLYTPVFSMVQFEFHMLPFAIPLALWCWWAVVYQRWVTAAVCIVALLLVREDVAFMTAGIGVLALFLYRRRALWFSVFTIAVSVAWFIAMYTVGAAIHKADTPMFFQFYYWLGETPLEVVRTVVLHPLYTLQGVLTQDHIAYIVITLAGLAFLPLAAPVYLLPAMVPLGLYLFTRAPMLEPLSTMHYASTIVPWLLLSALYGFACVQQRTAKEGWWRFTAQEIATSIPIIVLVCCVAHLVYFGGHWIVSAHLLQYQYFDRAAAREIIHSIPSSDAVLSSATLTPYLSQRAELYPELHVVTGHHHLSYNKPLEYTQPIQWMVLDYPKMARYMTSVPAGKYQHMHERFQRIIDRNRLVPHRASENSIVFAEADHAPNPIELFDNASAVPQNMYELLAGGDVMLSGFSYTPYSQQAGYQRLGLRLHTTTTLHVHKHIAFTWYDADGRKLKHTLQLAGYAIEPFTAWTVNEPRVHYFYIQHPAAASRMEIRIGEVKGYRVVPWMMESIVSDVDRDARSVAIPLQ